MRKNYQIKSESQLDSLADALELLLAMFDELEKEHDQKDQKNYELEKETESLESKLKKNADELEFLKKLFDVTWRSRIRRQKDE